MADAFSITKDPDSVINYTIDWTTPLNGDTISSSSWTADNGLTVDSDSNTTTTATVVVSAGRFKRTCNLINTIVTAAGLTLERTIRVTIDNV